MSSQDNTKIVQQAYADFKAGKIPALLDLVSDRIEWVIPQVADVAASGTRHGRDGVAEFFKILDETQGDHPL